jgi:hypothetical protein
MKARNLFVVALLVLLGALGGLTWKVGTVEAQNVPCNIDQGGAQINFDSGCTWTVGGTTVTSTAAELNILDTVTATAAELNTLDNAVAEVGYTIGSESSETIIVAVQFNDAAGTAMATRACLPFFLAADANGDAQEAAATALTAGTDGHIVEYVDETAGMGCTEADGDLDVSIENGAGADTLYLCFQLPSGALDCSAAITFA